MYILRITGFLLLFALNIIGSAVGEQILHSVTGEVGRENYTYYSLTYEGPIALYLHSKAGDADLYVSQFVAKPTYELDQHCLQSTTCGVDQVHIPRSFNRPVGIGVYGHVSHEVSAYSLVVYYREEDEEEYIEHSYPDEGEQENSSHKVKTRKSESQAYGQRDSTEHENKSENQDLTGTIKIEGRKLSVLERRLTVTLLIFFTAYWIILWY